MKVLVLNPVSRVKSYYKFNTLLIIIISEYINIMSLMFFLTLNKSDKVSFRKILGKPKSQEIDEINYSKNNDLIIIKND